MKVLCLTKYDRLGASSRLRFYQYFSFFKDSGIQVTILPLLNDRYINALYKGRLAWGSVLSGYLRRLISFAVLYKYEVVWLEKEFFPWLPIWIELGLLPGKVKLVIDYDDAIFHQYDQHPFLIVRWLLGRKIDSVMKRADLVIVGNKYLANRAKLAGACRIEILPTVVDIVKYKTDFSEPKKKVVIGWIGSPATAHYLKLIEPSIRKIKKIRDVEFRAIGANPEQLSDIPLKVIQWTEQTEIIEIQKFDIGIMPLPDKLFERGKCGYKLIQYMACGKPVVASPVSANKEIVRNGVDGYWASSLSEWEASLILLIDNLEKRREMGMAGRNRVEEFYSIQKAAPRMIKLFYSVV